MYGRDTILAHRARTRPASRSVGHLPCLVVPSTTVGTAVRYRIVMGMRSTDARHRPLKDRFSGIGLDEDELIHAHAVVEALGADDREERATHLLIIHTTLARPPQVLVDRLEDVA